MQLRPTMFFQASADGGQRLYVHHVPPEGQAVRGALLYVQPLMEEMNKSRRMVAMACRALAAQGWAVLQVDLKGCGDSSADFSEATWADWLDDLRQARRWLQERYPDCPRWWWGLRAGALPIGEMLRDEGASEHLLLWQPILRGDTVMTQLLRLKGAAHMMDGRSQEIVKSARADLAAGLPLEVAGYTLHPALSQGLAAARLNPPALGATRQLVWLEASSAPASGATAELSPVGQQACEAWRGAGWVVQAQAASGPAFWQTTELEDAPAFIAATVRCLAQTHAAH